VEDVEHRAYIETRKITSKSAGSHSRLLPHSRPVHEFVKVDLFIPGCPPEADTIFFALTELVAGRMPDLTGKTILEPNHHV